MKKFLALLLAVLMVLSVMGAAADQPSPKQEDIAKVVEEEKKEEKPATPTQKKEPVISVEDNDTEKETLKGIIEQVSAGGDALSYFPQDVQDQVAEEAGGEPVEMNEMVGLSVQGYEPAMGDTQVTLHLDTAYSPEQTLTAVVGVPTGEKDADGKSVIAWFVLDSDHVKALENGDVQITFPAELMAKMNGAGKAVLALFSTTDADRELAIFAENVDETQAKRSEAAGVLLDQKDKIAAFAKDQNVVDYFPDSVKNGIKDVDLSTLTLDEVDALFVLNYDPSMGDAEATFAFDTKYNEKQQLFVVLGFYDKLPEPGKESEAEPAWELAMPGVTAVNADGSVTVAFSGEQLMRIQNAPAVVMAILATPAE